MPCKIKSDTLPERSVAVAQKKLRLAFLANTTLFNNGAPFKTVYCKNMKVTVLLCPLLLRLQESFPQREAQRICLRGYVFRFGHFGKEVPWNTLL